jgi:putative phage-type endonuclease
VIAPQRFIANKAISKERWLEARRDGVTATQVSRAASGPGGFEQAVAEYREEFQETDNPYMKFGRDWEGPISMYLKDTFGVMPNEWLISAEENPRHLATPDGLSMEHFYISEVKTTGKEWNPERIPVQYRRQVQWQLYVTGAESCYFAWMLRQERNGVFVPAWFQPEWVVMERDEEMIASLVKVADELWERVNDE